MSFVIVYIVCAIIIPAITGLWYVMYVGIAGAVFLGLAELIAIKTNKRTISQMIQESKMWQKILLIISMVSFTTFMIGHLLWKW